jgi:CNT family concentrative nucleoside transporter
MGRLTGILGILTMLGLAFLFSTNRRAIRGKTVAWGLALQFAFAVFVLKVEVGRAIFQKAGDVVNRLLSYSSYGSQFVFGDLGKPGGHLGFYIAFQVLPTVIFIAAFFAILYHYGIMQFVVRQAARVMTRFMGASGAESLNVAASIFMGQTEAPLTIRPFLPDMTRSELMTVMTSGMAHVSGGIMAAYIAFGVEPKHILSAVIMTAPGAIVIAKMLVPETEIPKTAGRVVMSQEEVDAEKQENLLGAIARGTTDGLARLRGHRQPAGHAHGAERSCGVLHAGAATGDPRSALVHHCNLRAVRLREFWFYRNPDRRDRSVGAE